MENIDFSFILVTLHVQPEASIDVLASKYSNQIEFVRSIARTTPVSHKVLVKEHSNALGDRSYSFYKKLASIPRVTLVDPNIDSHYLIKSADLVISATGTASFEAAVLGTPAVTASEMFFSHLMVQKKFNPYVDDVKDLIQTGYLWKKKYSKEMIVAGMVKILRNSFEGDTTDILSNPNVVKKKNIHLLEKAFKELIANHEMK
jgi:UDP-N-acetylglucosamine 2-epimerase